MLEILKILRRVSQNNCLDIANTVITQLAQDYTGTSPKGDVKVLTSRTYRGASMTLRGPILKFMVYDLLIKLHFRSNSPCITYLFWSFTGKKIFKCSKRDIRETSTHSSCGTSLGPNNETLQRRPRDVSQNVFKFNSQTH